MSARVTQVDAGHVPAFTDDWALFLDVDGTLLDIAAHPDGVAVSPALKQVLDSAFRLSGGAVALISGRSLWDLDRLFGPMPFPAAGQHGLERRDSTGHVMRHDDTLNRLDRAVRALEVQAREHKGVLLEHKGLSLALHYRRAPASRDWVHRTMRALLDDVGPEFQLVMGKMVCELRPGGRDKGTAIADFMTELPFAGRVPVFIGDDVTDEDGFRVVNQAHGHSIKVGEGATHARWRLPDAQSVRVWLQTYIAFLGKGKTP